MKNEELQREEIETCHTLGGSGEVLRVEGRGEGVDTTLLSYTVLSPLFFILQGVVLGMTSFDCISIFLRGVRACIVTTHLGSRFLGSSGPRIS